MPAGNLGNWSTLCALTAVNRSPYIRQDPRASIEATITIDGPAGGFTQNVLARDGNSTQFGSVRTSQYPGAYDQFAAQGQTVVGQTGLGQTGMGRRGGQAGGTARAPSQETITGRIRQLPLCTGLAGAVSMTPNLTNGAPDGTYNVDFQAAYVDLQRLVPNSEFTVQPVIAQDRIHGSVLIEAGRETALPTADFAYSIHLTIQAP
jgi:hypothetical protein